MEGHNADCIDYWGVHNGLLEVHNGLEEVHNDLEEVHKYLEEVHKYLEEVHNDLEEDHSDQVEVHNYLTAVVESNCVMEPPGGHALVCGYHQAEARSGRAVSYHSLVS